MAYRIYVAILRESDNAEIESWSTVGVALSYARKLFQAARVALYVR